MSVLNLTAVRIWTLIVVVAFGASCAPVRQTSPPIPDTADTTNLPSTERSRDETIALFDLVEAQYTSDGDAMGISPQRQRQLLTLLASLDPTQLDKDRRQQLLVNLFQRGLKHRQHAAITQLRQRSLWWQWRNELTAKQSAQLDELEARYFIAIGEHANGLEMLLDNGDKLDRSDADTIWSILNQLSAQQLYNLESRAGTALGQLAALISDLRSYKDDYAKQLDVSEAWRERYPRHPINRNPSTYLEKLQSITDNSGTIAVILSQDDDSVHASAALTHGLLRHYYQLASQQKMPPLKFYSLDDETDYVSLYQRLRRDGAEQVIGPLRRSQLDRLLSQLVSPQPNRVQAASETDTLTEALLSTPSTTIDNRWQQTMLPTLVLNESTHSDATEKHTSALPLVQLPLAIEHELDQLLERAASRNAQRLLLVAPNGGWGARGASWFQERWRNRGGDIEVAYYSSNERDFTPLLQAPLALDDSAERKRDLQRLTGLALESRPRRRQDIDLVILLAGPEQARQIRPALDFNFASDLPVFATSHIYSADPRHARDLSGIEFPASLWQLQPFSHHQPERSLDPTLHQQLQALGADALSVTIRQAQFGASSAPLYANSGLLFASQSSYSRKGLWHKITDDGAREINAAQLDHRTAMKSLGNTHGAD
ncbi:MAG: penicillin-binding protein activator [Porticoccaceae bacterium]